MSSGKKWNLLSLFFDKTRLKSKIVYDLEKALGATYAVDNAFADVYYNGTYLGLYLITDRVDVGSGLIDVNDLDDFYKNDVIKNHDVIHQSEPFEANYYVMDNPQNITGAYLVELTPRDEIQDTEPFFTDCFGMSWKIKSPEHTTKEEVNYLYAISESLEQLSNNGDIWNYLDMDSFAKQYLIYHLCMETDQYTSSVFFVKEQNQDKILAVAPYDVDRSFGSSDISANYNTPVSLSPGSLGEKINKIYGSTLESEVAENYKEILPFCQKLIKNGIDSYVSEIDKSRKMDDMILRSFHVFDSSTYTYQEYDDEIKYLKYYFSKRLKSLSDGLSVDFDERVYVPESDGTFHNVIIKDANGSIVRNMEVIDGGQINIEGLNDTSFVLKSDRHFYDFMPVYDDLSLAIE